MADGLGYTEGAGKTVATDDAGASGHIQLFKLAYSADGVATLVQVDANGLLVNVGAAVAEDTAHASGDKGFPVWGVRKDTPAAFCGDGDYSPLMVNSYGQIEAVIVRNQLRISVDSGGLTTATTAYTSGDQVGTQFTMPNAARVSGGTGRITHILLTSAADIIGQFDVVVARESITLAADNAAYAISDADAKKVLSMVQLNGAFDIGNNRLGIGQNVNIPYDCVGGTSLYFGLITRSGHTFFGATTDLQLTITVERD